VDPIESALAHLCGPAPWRTRILGMTTSDIGPDFLDIHEAAKALDLSTEALRKRISRGKIEAIKEDGHWFVQVLDSSQDGVRTSPDEVQTTAGQHVDAQELAIAAMEARIASLEDHLVSTREQLQAKDTQIDQLHRLLATTALNQAPAKPWWKIW